MDSRTATALAHPNIAFIKYWGNTDDLLRLPENGSISMNLAGLQAETTVTWHDDTPADTLRLNGADQAGDALRRVSRHLDALRSRLEISSRAQVVSDNNFPTGAGIASSAAAFAALTVAGCAAAGASIGERELTTLARLGSGSASRSVPGGFVEWYPAETHEDSFAETIAPADHWELVDLVAVVSTGHKSVGSTAGHATARTSPLQVARVADAPRRLNLCRNALLQRNFPAFADVVEQDSTIMHSVMMTGHPALYYWQAASLGLMQQVRSWRADGVQVCFTLDAGPNVHCICLEDAAATVKSLVSGYPGVQAVLEARPGGPAVVV